MLRTKLRGVQRRIAGGSGSAEPDKASQRKLVISAPTNFQHAAHISAESATPADQAPVQDVSVASPSRPARKRMTISGPLPAMGNKVAGETRKAVVVKSDKMTPDVDGTLLEGYLRLGADGQNELWCKLKAGSGAVLAYSDPSCKTFVAAVHLTNLVSASVTEPIDAQSETTVELAYKTCHRALMCASHEKAHLWARAITTAASDPRAHKVRPGRTPPPPPAPTRPNRKAPPPPPSQLNSDPTISTRSQLEDEFEALCMAQGLLQRRYPSEAHSEPVVGPETEPAVSDTAVLSTESPEPQNTHRLSSTLLAESVGVDESVLSPRSKLEQEFESLCIAQGLLQKRNLSETQSEPMIADADCADIVTMDQTGVHDAGGDEDGCITETVTNTLESSPTPSVGTSVFAEDVPQAGTTNNLQPSPSASPIRPPSPEEEIQTGVDDPYGTDETDESDLDECDQVCDCCLPVVNKYKMRIAELEFKLEQALSKS